MHLSQASVGRMLFALEQRGFLKKASNKGRIVTELGIAYLNSQEQFHEKLNTAKEIIESVSSNLKHKLCEILEIRIALESLSAANACLNVTEDDLKELDTLMLEHFYDLRQGGIGSEQDLQLHLKIAELSGNNSLAQILKLILTQENAYTKFSIIAPHITSSQLKEHTDIVEAIRLKNSCKAKDAMIAHLSQVMENVEKYYNN